MRVGLGEGDRIAKEYAKAFYNSSAWKKCKSSYIKSVYGLCEKCGNPGYIVHHKKHLTPSNINNPNVSLNHDNLEYLCQNCHNEEHGRFIKKSSVKKGFTFNERGELVPMT